MPFICKILLSESKHIAPSFQVDLSCSSQTGSSSVTLGSQGNGFLPTMVTSKSKGERAPVVGAILPHEMGEASFGGCPGRPLVQASFDEPDLASRTSKVKQNKKKGKK